MSAKNGELTVVSPTGENEDEKSSGRGKGEYL
jgi:hypothetical protein